MVELNKVSVEEFQVPVSCRVREGSFAAIITSGEAAGEALIRLVLGLETPDEGKLTVLGKDPETLTDEELVDFRRQIGVVQPGGSLISNLKIEENVSLPLAYHGRQTDSELESLTVDALQRVGYVGSLSELPGNLPIHLRRLIGFARVLLINPRLVIYNATFEGLQSHERERLVNLAIDFHNEKKDRTSLLVTASQAGHHGLPLDDIFNGR